MEPEAPTDTSPAFQSRAEKMLYELMKKALTECVTQQSLTEEFKERALAVWQKLLVEGEKDINVMKEKLRKDLGKSHGKTYADMCEKIWTPLGNLVKQINNRKQAVNSAQQQAAASAPARGSMAAIPPSSVPNKPPNLYQQLPAGAGVYQPSNLNLNHPNPFRPSTSITGIAQSRPDPSKIQYTPVSAAPQPAATFGNQPLPHQQTTTISSFPRPPPDQNDIDGMLEKGDLATEFTLDHGRVLGGVMTMQQINEQQQASQPRVPYASNVQQQQQLQPTFGGNAPGNTFTRGGNKSSLSIPTIEPLDPDLANLIDPTRVEFLLQKIVSNLSQKVTITDAAKRLLSQGIQNHLLSLLENAISTARARMQLSINMKYRSMYAYFANDRSVDQSVLSDCAMKWGPDTRFLLSREEEKARYLLTKFTDMDREHLYGIHKDIMAAKTSTTTVGNKRKAEEIEATSWRTIDEQAAKEGRMTAEQLANMYFKLQVLSPNARDIIPRSIQLPFRETPEHPFRLTSENQIHLTVKDMLSILREFNGREGNRIVLRALAGKLSL